MEHNAEGRNTLTLDAKFDSEKFRTLIGSAMKQCFHFCSNKEEDPHYVAEAMCWKCGKRWIAVYPTGTLLKELECPGCGNVGYAFHTGQDIVQDDE